MQFSVYTARSHLSRLIDAVLAGEEVVIAKGSTPVVRLVPIQQTTFKFGTLVGFMSEPPSFLGQIDSQQQKAWKDA